MDIHNQQRKSFTKRLLLICYSLLWTLLIANTYFFIKVLLIFRGDDFIKKGYVIERYKMVKYYPIIQVISYFPSTVNRLVDMFTNREEFFLSIIQTVLEGSQGLIICVIFLSTEPMKYIIKDFLYKFCGKRTPEETLHMTINHDYTIDKKTDDLSKNNETTDYFLDKDG